MFRTLHTAAAVSLIATATLAQGGLFDDIERREAEGDVATVMDRLESAVTEAGATVFARIDHGAGAADAGMTLAPSQLLIFGNPALGTPAMQDDPLAGLYLPLKVLVYDDGSGQVWVAYEEVEETLDDLQIDDDADYIEKMEDALENLTAKAVGGS